MPPDVDITLIILVAMVVGVPILGVSVRLAIKPIVEALLILQESVSAPSAPGTQGIPPGETQLRLARLEEEVGRLTRALEAGAVGERANQEEAKMEGHDPKGSD